MYNFFIPEIGYLCHWHVNYVCLNGFFIFLKFLKFMANASDFHSKDVIKRTSSQNLLLMQLISNWALSHTVEKLIMLVISNWHHIAHSSDFEITHWITP